MVNLGPRRQAGRGSAWLAVGALLLAATLLAAIAVAFLDGSRERFDGRQGATGPRRETPGTRAGAAVGAPGGLDEHDPAASRRGWYRTASAPQSPERSPSVVALASARRYAERRRGSVSFAIVDTEGRTSGKDARRPFRSASVVKAMLLVAYLDAIDRQGRSLTGDEQSLLEAMVTESDNAAASAVAAEVGEGGVRAVARRAGMRGFAPSAAWGNSTITAADQARFFLKIDRLVPRGHRAFARRVLAGVVDWQRWGIPQQVPSAWKVFFKGGWRPTPAGELVHQVALLEAGRRRLALAVLTAANPSHEYGVRTLEGIAARLVDEPPEARDGAIRRLTSRP